MEEFTIHPNTIKSLSTGQVVLLTKIPTSAATPLTIFAWTPGADAMPTTRSTPARRAADPPHPRSLLKDVMPSAQTAEILGLRVSTSEDYARRGLLPSIKLGRHRRFLRSQVEQSIADMAGVR